MEDAANFQEPGRSAVIVCVKRSWIQWGLGKLAEAEGLIDLGYISDEFAVLEGQALRQAIDRIEDLFGVLAANPRRIGPAFELSETDISDDIERITSQVQFELARAPTLPECNEFGWEGANYAEFLRYAKGHHMCLQIAARSNSLIACGWFGGYRYSSASQLCV